MSLYKIDMCIINNNIYLLAIFATLGISADGRNGSEETN